jgi:hypothetical protein
MESKAKNEEKRWKNTAMKVNKIYDNCWQYSHHRQELQLDDPDG